MKDITVIIPLHKIQEGDVDNFLAEALDSVEGCKEYYKNGKIITMIVGPEEVINDIKENVKIGKDTVFCVNEDETDFCSQINRAVEDVKTEHFSILEFDDAYAVKWFKMVSDYSYGNESVSLFLPVNVVVDTDMNIHSFMNEIAWSSSFSEEIGYLDESSLMDYVGFNITGGVFNTSDFKAVGGLKPSLKVAFGYEYLLRLAKKGLKIYVVPKQGLYHTIGREGSLTTSYDEYTNEEIVKWHDLAKIECVFNEDRGNTIDNIKAEVLK